MELQAGMVINIQDGHKIGLDLPAGEVQVQSITSLEDNYSIKADVERFLAPLMPKMVDVLRESSTYIMEVMEDITTKKDGDWAIFHYTKRKIDDNYHTVVIPVSDFFQLLDEATQNRILDSM